MNSFNIDDILVAGIELILSPGVLSEDLSFSDYAEQALKKLFQKRSISGKDVSVLVSCTQTPDYRSPASSFVLQNKLGISNDCIVTDINSSGMALPIGMSTVCTLLKQSNGDYGVLVLGDTLEKQLPPDKQEYLGMRLGNGAAALLFSKKAQAPSIKIRLFSSSSGYKGVFIRKGGFRHQDPVAYEKDQNLQLESEHYLQIDDLSVRASMQDLIKRMSKYHEDDLQNHSNSYDLMISNVPMSREDLKSVKICAKHTSFGPKDQYYGAATSLVELAAINTGSPGKKKIFFVCFGEGISLGTIDITIDPALCSLEFR